MPALVPFIQDGLSRDEQFVYIADDQTVEDLKVSYNRTGSMLVKNVTAEH